MFIVVVAVIVHTYNEKRENKEKAENRNIYRVNYPNAWLQESIVRTVEYKSSFFGLSSIQFIHLFLSYNTHFYLFIYF